MEAYPIINPTVLVIEDNPDDTHIVEWQLQSEGFQVICTADGRQGLIHVCDVLPDLVLLDVDIPGMNGHTVCQRIREISDVPIIIVSAHGQPDEVVEGLKLGADDYLVKPYSKEVLIARARATLRRAAAPPHPNQGRKIYNDGHLAINLPQRRVSVDGETVHLSPIEFSLLSILMEASPRIVPYRALLEEVWGFEYIDDIDYLRVYIWHLRSKIEQNPKEPKYVLNELGVGYRFQRQT